MGEGIKKGSVTLIDNQNSVLETLYADDSFGNLQSSNDKIIISKIDIESGSIDFTDSGWATYGDPYCTIKKWAKTQNIQWDGMASYDNGC